MQRSHVEGRDSVKSRRGEQLDGIEDDTNDDEDAVAAYGRQITATVPVPCTARTDAFPRDRVGLLGA